MKPVFVKPFFLTAILAGICLLYSQYAYAQSDMLITTTAASGMTVCGEPVTFTVTIQNTAGTLLEDIRLNPGLVPGVAYVPGSAVNMTEITPLNIDNPRFFLPNIAAGNVLTVSFQARASCALITYIRNNHSQDPAAATPIRNATTLTYNKAGTIDLTLAEPNGSESYNVAYADLDISVNAEDINQTGNKPFETFQRRVSVRNSGLGSVSTMSFYVTIPGDMSLLKLKVVNPAGATLRVLTPAGVENGKYRYDITDFSQAGDGDALLEQNETIFFKDSVQAETCSASLETKYATSWGCQSVTCNEGVLEGVTHAYIAIPSGNTTVTPAYTIVNPGGVTWCATGGATLQFTLSNTGSATPSPVLQGAFNIQWSLVTDIRVALVQQIYLANGTDITNLITSRVTEGNTEFITLNFDNALSANPGPQASLTDLDGDGYFDDLAPAQSLTLSVTIGARRPQGIEQCAGADLLFRIFENSWQYTESCGNVENTQSLVNEFKYEPLEKKIAGNANPQADVTERYTFAIDSRLNTGIFNCSAPVYTSVFSVPRGMIIQQALWKSATATAPVTVPYTIAQDTVITVNSGGGLAGEYYLDFVINCSLASPQAVGTISWNMDYQCNAGCPDQKLSLACETKEIFNPCVSCSGFITSFFSFERVTFGWQPPASGQYRFDELFGSNPIAPRIDRTFPGIKLDAAYPHDVVQLQARGKLSETSAPFSNAHISLSYESTAGMLFDFVAGSFALNGVNYNFQEGYVPTVTQQGNVTTVDFNLPLGTQGSSATITPGMTVDIIANFSVKPLATLARGAYTLQRLRLRHYGLAPGNVVVACNSIESKFSVLKPEARIAMASGLYQCEDQVYLLRMAFTSATTATGLLRDDFPLEFRPLAYLTQFTATAPQGYVFDPAVPLKLTFLERSTTHTITNVQFSNGNRTIQFTRDGAFPVTDIDDDADDDQYVIAAMIPDCVNANNLFQPPAPGVIRTDLIPVATQYRAAAYLTDPTRHTAQSASGNTTSSNYRNVDMAMIVNATQEGVGEEVRWPVSLCNQNGLPFSVIPANNWVAVELKAQDQSIVLKGATLDNGTALPVVFYGPTDATHPQGRFMLVKLGAISDATCKNFFVIANYVNCVEDQLQALDIYSAWNCKAYPAVTATTASILDVASCEVPVLDNELNLRFKTANLQWTVTRTSPEITDLCSNASFSVTLTSSRYADLNNAFLRLELPPGMTLATGVTPTFSYPLSTPAQPIPAPLTILNGNIVSWKIDDIIGGPLPGTRVTDNAVRINLGLTPDCSVDPGLPVIFRAEARTNCGDPLALADQRKIRITGVPLDELSATINATSYPFCERANIVEVTVQNRGAVATGPEQLTVTLPAGITFAGLTDNAVGAPVITTTGAGTLLTWNLPSGYWSPGLHRTFGFRTTIAESDFGTPKTISARTVINGQATCIASGSECPLIATTSEASIPVSFTNNQPQVVITASPSVTVCSGTTVSLSATLSENVNPANYTFTWSPGNATGHQLTITATQSQQYIVMAQSNTGCVAKDTVSIGILPAAVISNVQTLATTCVSSTDGALSFTLSGGAGPFAYSVQTPAGNIISAQTGGNVNLTGLGVGGHQLTVTNAEGCQASRTIFVPNGGPTFNICTTSLPCDASGGEVSHASILVSRLRPQSTGVFSYLILKNATETVYAGEGSFGSPVLHDLVYEESASYTFQVLQQGDNTCSLAPTPVILRKALLAVALNDGDAIYEKCYAGQQVSVALTSTLNLTGCTPAGTNQFVYQLYHEGVASGQPITAGATHTFTLSEPGNYSVETSSLDNTYGTCLLSRAFTIVESTMEVSVQTVNAKCHGSADGSAQAVVAGGQPPYSYQWLNGSGTVISRLSGVTGLAAGDYSVVVADSRGCDVTAQTDFTITNPEPFGAITFILPTNLTCNVTAEMTPPGGTAPYTFFWVRIDTVKSSRLSFTGDIASWLRGKRPMENTVYTDNNPTLSGNIVSSSSTSDLIKPGYYIVRVQDANGCKTESALQRIAQPPVNRTYQLCFRWKSAAEEEETEPDPDIKVVNGATIASAAMGKAIAEKTNACITAKVAQTGAAYQETCLSADHLDDAVTVSYRQKEYHHTLYYYDRAGNLVRTVPPQGVHPLEDGAISRKNQPVHEQVTTYDYNSLAQTLAQVTPDAGRSELIYNDLGQLRFSQDAQQVQNNQASYSKYDELGRVVEAGEMILGGTYSPDGTAVYDVSNFNALKNAGLINLDKASYETLSTANRFPLQSAAIIEHTTTTYHQPAGGTDLARPQRFLRNRISYAQSFDNLFQDPITTIYSYDPHGNVAWHAQKIPGLNTREVAYSYDLVSGKVRDVQYNSGKKDQFFHRYTYDEDNRLLSASTSADGIVWDKDAAYSYYLHGPLKRMVIGEDLVQGVDYVYTFHGWIKGINFPSQNTSYDPGKDGRTTVPADVFGLTLTYYNGDFAAVQSQFASNGLLPTPANLNLYNGNVSSWTTRILPVKGIPNAGQTTGMLFRYDRLNRIKNSEFFRHQNAAWQASQDFRTDYTYDGNGNLQTLNRHALGTGKLHLDSLAYHYYPGTNQLAYVTDPVDATRAGFDIDNQQAGNYTYDAIGNLVTDATGQINQIDWNMANKVRTVIRNGNTTVRFRYDASGYRVMKQVIPASGDSITTFYIRDASGNTMSVYEQRADTTVTGSSGYDIVTLLAEQPVYGSDRLGQRLPKLEVLRMRYVNGNATGTAVEDDAMQTRSSWPVLALPSQASAGSSVTVINVSGENPQVASSLPVRTGNRYSHVATGRNDAGELLFHMTVADNAGGVANTVYLLDKNGNVMPGINGATYTPTKAKGNGFSHVLRITGSDHYHITTVDVNGKAWLHTIDMSQPGNGTAEAPLGAVVATNQALDAARDYVQGMALVQDNRLGREAHVYMLRKATQTDMLELVRHTFTSSLTPETQVLETIEAFHGGVIAKVSPDATLLGVMVPKGEQFLGDITDLGMEMRLYNLSGNFRQASLDVAYAIEPEATMYNFEFDSVANHIYYVQFDLNGRRLCRRPLRNGNTDILRNMSNVAQVMRAPNGKLYAAERSRNFLVEITPGETATLRNVSVALPAGHTLSGALSQQPVVLTADVAEESFAFYRDIGRKQYELKDHLGSVRAVVTDLKRPRNTAGFSAEIAAGYEYYPFGMQMPFLIPGDSSVYTATLEESRQAQESEDFGASYAAASRVTSPLYNHTPGTAVAGAVRSARLTGAQNDIIGLSKSLEVGAGDTITMEVYAKYVEPAPDADLTNIAAYIGSSFTASFGLAPDVDGPLYNYFTDLYSAGPVFAPDNTDNVPDAYLNYLLFDENYVLVDAGYQPITEDALENGTDRPHEKLALEVVPAQNGYLYIYLSNESGKISEVFFDDFKIVHTTTLLSNEVLAYRYGFGGHEKDDEIAGKGNYLSFNDYGYDARLGRRWRLDPVDEIGISGYAAFKNNPIFYQDPNGESPISVFAKAIAKAGIKKATKEFVESQIKKRLVTYMGKQGARKWATQLADDAMAFIDYATATAWWEYAIELVPIVGDAWGATQLGKQGYRVWKGLEKFEKLAELGDRAAKSAWKVLGSNTGLTGKGADKLKSWIENVNKNFGDKLNDNTIAGAIKEKFGLNSGFKPDGTPFKHLNSLDDRMRGLQNQISDLQKQIKEGAFEGEALKGAEGVLNAAQKQYDEISNVITSADKAVKTMGKVYE